MRPACAAGLLTCSDDRAAAQWGRGTAVGGVYDPVIDPARRNDAIDRIRGLTAADIAATLGIAPSTVETHTLRLFDKVGVHGRTQLASPPEICRWD